MVAIASPLSAPARQARSRATSDAIVEAGLDLLNERDFDTVSVADVVARAGVSVGGFYARFRGKDALLHALAAQVIGDCAGSLEAALSPGRMSTASLERVVRTYVTVMVTKFRAHRGAILQILRHARAGDAHLALVIGQFNQRVHGRLRTLLAERRDHIRHPDPAMAANFGLFTISAAAREAVLSGSLRVYPVSLTDAQVVDELVRMYLGYLMGASGRSRASR